MTHCLELDAGIRELTDPALVMQRIVDQVLLLTPAAEGAVVELAGEAQLICASAAGRLADDVGALSPLDEGLSGLALRNAETVVCDDAARDGRVDGDATARTGARSIVCIPLYRGGETVGVLKVSGSAPGALGEQAVATLASLAEFISAAIGAAAEIAHVTTELLSLDTNVNEYVANVLAPGTVAEMRTRQSIERVLADEDLGIVCQPIVDLCSGELVGLEALARFPSPPGYPPDVWFDQAHQAGLGVELELVAVRTALKLLDRLPEHAFLAVNIGPDAITEAGLPAILACAGAERVVLELTEHRRVADYAHLRQALQGIRAVGARVAIDDTGAGFASLLHVLKLAPDILKLDRDITRGIDCDPVRRALARALVSFAKETGAEVTAEGIETTGELEAARELGMSCGQGYLLGTPTPLAGVSRAGARVARVRDAAIAPRPRAMVAG